MGRKKRKVAVAEEGGEESTVAVRIEDDEPETPTALKEEEKAEASKYSMQSHSAEIVGADLYVSDGSESDDDLQIVLQGSKMGLMRRGLVQPLHTQHKQWTRSSADDEDNPADRAARLAQEKLEEQQEQERAARLKESQENAGRDPLLFSKRTAFDIRLDASEDKPWTRSHDQTDFLNYGLTESEWSEYAQQQVRIRTELTESHKQKRPVNPDIVPVLPVKKDTEEDGEAGPAVAPANDEAKKDEPVKKEVKEEPKEEEAVEELPPAEGGAWAIPKGSRLAEMLDGQGGGGDDWRGPPPPPRGGPPDHYDRSRRGGRGGGGRSLHDDRSYDSRKRPRDDHRDDRRRW